MTNRRSVKVAEGGKVDEPGVNATRIPFANGAGGLTTTGAAVGGGGGTTTPSPCGTAGGAAAKSGNGPDSTASVGAGTLSRLVAASFGPGRGGGAGAGEGAASTVTRLAFGSAAAGFGGGATGGTVLIGSRAASAVAASRCAARESPIRCSAAISGANGRAGVVPIYGYGSFTPGGGGRNWVIGPPFHVVEQVDRAIQRPFAPGKRQCQAQHPQARTPGTLSQHLRLPTVDGRNNNHKVGQPSPQLA